jgi:hypothetical protein
MRPDGIVNRNFGTIIPPQKGIRFIMINENHLPAMLLRLPFASSHHQVWICDKIHLSIILVSLYIYDARDG